MKIEIGKYVLYSDQWSMWINEKTVAVEQDFKRIEAMSK